MNCCDEYGDCRQGRDCPVRKAQQCAHCHGIGYDASGQRCECTMIAKVARVGRKDYDREALPRSPWRVYVRHLAKWMLICIAVLFAAAFTAGVLHA